MTAQTMLKLSPAMEAAILAYADDAHATVHTSTTVALITRKLISTRTEDGHALTAAGRVLVASLRGVAQVDAAFLPMTAAQATKRAGEPLPRRTPLNSPASVAGRTMSPLARATAYAAQNARNGLRVTMLTPAQRRRIVKAQNRAAGKVS